MTVLPASLTGALAAAVQSASWTGVVLALIAGVAGAVLALRSSRSHLAWISVGATAAALLLTGLAGTAAPRSWRSPSPCWPSRPPSSAAAPSS
ncbi:hypothetical protein Q0F99_15860 [Rathayibacter oskolensis]|uniref:hypothetical protein n=1 Tax=Rathayibacter oskolensis TaxID=1891671 RepID=UPI00265F9EB4|nr:hypothetical protein [Rathayibacter oskolensis]WKK71072.1 hypothetical protein Q0F99_15860 [Rathayibacter oskolensis]